MLKKIIKYIIGVLGFVIGFGLSTIFKGILDTGTLMSDWRKLAIQLVFSFIIGIIFYLYSQKIIDRWKVYMGLLESELEKIPLNEVVLGTFGLVIGLIISNLLSKPLEHISISYVNFILQMFLHGGLGYFGIKIMTGKRSDISPLGERIESYQKTRMEIIDGNNGRPIPKILDTSVIIDGRLLDICRIGFIEGPLIITEFILKELQNLADSTDDLERRKGRRGLDILNELQKDVIQKELDVEVIISYEKLDEAEFVDSKLLELARLMQGKIITNDYNLNKVAKIHGIDVLNISDLANALKPIVIPGEEIEAYVAKNGKEEGQGLAYLDDGTMIVIEAGEDFIGNTIEVIVTSALQTSAGKMIFAKPKLMDK